MLKASAMGCRVAVLASLTLGGPQATAAWAQGAETIPAPVVAAARGARTLRAEIVMTWTAGGVRKQSTGTVRLMKPNFAEIRLKGDYPLHVLVSDGRTIYTVEEKPLYKRSPSDANGSDINQPWWGMPFRFFFTQNTNPFGDVPDPGVQLRRVAEETRSAEGGAEIFRQGTAPMAYTETVRFDRRGVLVHSVVHFGDPAQGGASFEASVSGVKLNEPMRAASFRYVPAGGVALDESDPAGNLLALGSLAADFTLPSPGSAPVSLASERKGAKVVLVNFWYLDCAPCRIEFPELEKIFAEFHPAGLGMVAVDKGDTGAPVASYVAKTGLTMPVALGGELKAGSVFEQYRVESFPATYLLDSEGKVLYRSALADMTGLRKRLAELGFR